MTKPTFETIRTVKSYTRGCPRCGADTNEGAVMVSAQALKTNGAVGGGRIASKMRSFCEPCTVEVYQQVLAALVAASDNNAEGDAA